MKKIISVVLTLTLLAGILMLSGCSLKTEKLDTAALLGNYNIEELKGTEINVYNWGEYISDGEGGSVDVISEFEKLTGIKVNYNMYDSNEDLYAKLKSGGVNYDVIIPSDYMAERLKNEGLLQKLDYSVITNYEGIGDEYKKEHHRNTRNYFRIHHRYVCNGHNGTSQPPFFHRIYSDCRRRSDNNRNKSGGNG